MLRRVGSNWLLLLLQVAAAFVLTPFVIRKLGNTQYGAWTLITSITSYLSMLALGIPMTTVRYVAKYSAGGDDEAMNRSISSCAGLYLLIGLVSAVVGGVLLLLFDRVYDIPAAVRGEARWAFALVVLNISASFIGQLPYGIMAAHGDFTKRNAVQMISLLIRLGLTYALLTLRASMVWLAIIQLACFTVEFIVGSLLVSKLYPRVRLTLDGFDTAMIREMVGFSVFVLILNVGGQLTFETDAIVIAAFLPVDAIPKFSIASSLSVYLINFMIAIGSVVMPLAAARQAQANMSELQDVFLKWSKIAVAMTLFCCLYLIVLGPSFLGWWVGREFEDPAGEVLRILMAGNLLFLPVRGLCLPVLMGLGKPRLVTLTFFGVSLVNVAMSVALAGPLGLAGVAIGTAIPNAMFAIVTLILACRELAIPLRDYMHYAVLRPVVAAVPVLILLLWSHAHFDVHGFAGLCAAGVASLMLYGALHFAYVFRRDRLLNAPAWFAPLRARLP